MRHRSSMSRRLRAEPAADRGTCSFTQKARNVQTAGAIGLIVVNNVDRALPPARAARQKKGFGAVHSERPDHITAC